MQPALERIASRPGGKAPPWRVITKIAFRFAFVYFGLYNSSLVFDFLPFPPFSQIGRLYAGLRSHLVVWVSKHVLQLPHDFGNDYLNLGSGSKDTTYIWVEILCYLVIAAIATVVWSLMDKKRHDYCYLHRWLLVYLRLSLAAGLLGYGVPKLLPVQFPPPTFAQTVTPVGNFARDSLLWLTMGVAPIYSFFGGLMEVVPALLLVVPRLAMLGGLLSIATMANVLMLNLGYDIGVKSVAINMLLIGVVIVLPDAQRLTNFFILNRSVPATCQKPLFRRLWFNRVAVGLQIAFGIVLFSHDFYRCRQFIMESAESSNVPLHGIWLVDDYKINGESRPPLTSNAHRWQRLIVNYRSEAVVQVMTGELQYLFLRTDPQTHSFVLTEPGNAEWIAEFKYDDSQSGSLVLQGTMGRLPVLVSLHREDVSKLPLNDHTLRWVRDASPQ